MSRSPARPTSFLRRLGRRAWLACVISVTPLNAQAPEPSLTVLHSSSERMAPAVVFANVTGSSAQEPEITWHRSRVKWDFGDAGTMRLRTTDPRTQQTIFLTNAQQGFNAAYIYQRSDKYDLSAQISNGTGQRTTVNASVEIVPDTRTERFVSASLGSDKNDGLTPATAWATYDFALRNATDNMRVRFRRGDAFEVDGASVNSPGPVANFMIDAYGTGPKPVLLWVDPLMGEVFNAANGSENLIIRNIRFECASSISDNVGNAIAIGTGVAATVWDCEFAGHPEGRGFNRWIENHSGHGADGLLVLNCAGGASASYNFTLGGDAFVNGSTYIGITTAGAVNEAVVRGSFHNDQPATRVNFQFCDLRNRVGDKESLRFQASVLGHVHRSMLSGVQVSHSQGPTDDIILDRTVFVSGRDINGIYLTDNSRDLMVRNCVFEMRDDYRNAITTGSGTFEIGSDRIEILNNTFRNTAPNRNKTPIHFGSDLPIYRIRICNNLFVVPDDFNDRFFDMPSPASMSLVFGNVFPDRGGAFEYAAVAGISLDWATMQALEFTGIQARETVRPVDIVAFYLFNPQRFRIAANAGRTVPGVFEDFHGQARRRGPLEPWAAGAVDPRPLTQPR